jgi:predicted O-methyltransferase YrrM
MFFKLLLACLACFSTTEDPYAGVEMLPFDPQGWYLNARDMEKIFKKHKIKTVVEVGSWLGTSTRHIASLLPRGGKIYAVDHWEGSIEHQSDPRTPHLYQQFLSNVIHTGLTNKIVPVKMASLEAASYLDGLQVDLVYLDGAHDTESVLQDLRAWYPFVKGHGIICGDDWGWSSVAEAVQIFARENGLKIHHRDNFWRLK